MYTQKSKTSVEGMSYSVWPTKKNKNEIFEDKWLLNSCGYVTVQEFPNIF